MMKTFGLTSLTLLLVLPFVLSGPVSSGSSCSPQCRSSRSKFRYEPGTTYNYQFETSTQTNVAFTSASEDAVLTVKGEALLTFRSECDVSIELTKTSIFGLDSKKIDSSALEKFSTTVSFQDGSIESICSHPNDASWVVNIKRAVLSMLQHSSQFLEVSDDYVYENDVIGRCATKYTVGGSGKSLRVVKTKVPNQCTQRQNRQSSMLTVAYNTPSENQNIPLLDSTSSCVQEITDGIVLSTMCKEAHLFRPLSSEKEGGARTDATSTISFIRKSPAKSVSAAANVLESDLTFDMSATQSDMNTARNMDAIINSLCIQLEKESPTTSSALFTELVRSMRTATSKTIKASYNNLLNKKNCKESKKTMMMFLDALPQAGSTGSIMLMSELLQNNQISSRQSLGWYLSFPLSKFVSIEAIQSLVPLVEAASDSPIALLGISGMVRRVCIKNMEECQQSRDVLLLSERINSLINCHSTNEPKTLSGLKALGNMGIMSPKVQENVLKCVRDASVAVPVRLAAIDAFRSSPCSSDLNNIFLTIMENERDNEIPIAAYLAVMRCPTATEDTLVRVTDYLGHWSRGPHYVKAFIRSHLNNIEKNPIPSMAHVRSLVEKLNYKDDEKPLREPNKVVADFCPTNNVGYSADLNVISQKQSIVPHSVGLNLTLDLFGQSVNLFEIGARGDNLELLLGNVLRKYWSEDNAIFKGDEDKQVKLDAFVRVFGSEIGMFNYRSKGQLNMASDLKARVSQALQQLMEGAKKVDIDVARSFMFLDSSVTFPTVAGMPIRLAVNGSTTVSLGLESKLDFAALMRDMRNFDMGVKINPFAVTQLAASMTVDMGIAETGIKMVSTIHSSAAADFSATRKQNQQLEVRFDLPNSKMTLIDFSSELLRVYKAGYDNQVKKININNGMEYKHGGCSERLSPITGLRLCAQSRLNVPRPLANPQMDPVPSFPLSGHGDFSIVLEKTDASMKGYYLKLDMTDLSPSKSRSKSPEHIKLEGTMSTSPNSQFRFETELRNSENIKLASLQVTRNNRNYYSKVQVNIDKQRDQTVYTSTVEIEHPDQPRTAVFEGKVNHRVGSSMEISLKPKGPLAGLPMQLQATVARQMTAKNTKLSLTDAFIMTPFGNTVINTAEVKVQPDTSSIVLDMAYGAEMHTVVLNSSMVRYSGFVGGELSYKSSRFPQTNFGISYKNVMKNGNYRKLVVTHGPESESNRLTMIQSLNRGDDDSRFDNYLKVTYPPFGINHEVNQTFSYDEDRMIAEGSFKYEVNAKPYFNGKMKIRAAPSDIPRAIYQFDLEGAYLDKKLVIQDTCTQLSDSSDSYSNSPVLKIQSGSHKYEVSGKTIFRSSHRGVSLSLEADVKSPRSTSPMKFLHSLQFNDDASFSNKLIDGGKTKFVFDVRMSDRIPNMEINFFLADIIDSKLSIGISVNKSSQIQEPRFNLDMNFLRLQRHVKINAHYRADKQKLLQNTHAQIQWDASRDPTKQISLDLSIENKSKPSNRMFDVGATLTVEDRPYTLTVSTERKHLEIVKAEIEFQLPDQRKTKFVVSNSFTRTGLKAKNVFEFGTALFSGMTYRVDSVIEINDSESAFLPSISFETNVKSSAHEDITMKFEFKEGLGQLAGYEAKLHVYAPSYVVSNDFDMLARIELGRESYRLISNYKRDSGKTVIFNLDVLHSRTSPAYGVEKLIDRVDFELAASKKLKYSTVREMTITRTLELFLIEGKENSIATYDDKPLFTEDNSFKFNGNSLEFKVNSSHPPSNFRYGFALRYATSDSTQRDDVNGSVGVTWSYDAAPSQPLRRRFKSRNAPDQMKEIRFDFQFSMTDGTVNLKTDTVTPFEGYKNLKLEIDVLHLELEMLKIKVNAALEDVESKLSFVLARPSRDQINTEVKLTHSDYEPMSFVLNLGYGSTYTLKHRIEYGEAYLALNGTMKSYKGNFDFNMLIDSPVLGIQKYELYGTNNIQGQDRVIEFVLKKLGKTLGNVKTTYKEKITRAMKEYQITTEFNVVEPQMSGSIKGNLQNKSTRNGNQYILKVNSDELGSLTANIKANRFENIALIQTCSSKKECNELNFSLIHTAKLNKKALTLLFKSKPKRGSADRRGIRASYASLGNTFEHVFEAILSEAQSKKITYKASRKGNVYNVELSTPKRTSAAILETGAGKNTLSVWADKTKFPERKLEIVHTLRSTKKNNMNGFQTSLTFKHPLLPRDIKMEMAAHHRITEDQYQSETVLDFDVFDSVHKRWTVTNQVKAWNDLQVDIVTELSSQGTGDSIVLELLQDKRSHYASSANLKFKSKNTIQKELFVALEKFDHGYLFRLGSPFKKFSVRTDIGSSELKITTQLFGMTPSVFLAEYKNDGSRFDVRVFNEATREIVYHLTASVDGTWKLSFVQHFGTEEKDVVLISSEVNTDDILVTRLSWNLEHLAAVRNAVRSRFQTATKEASYTIKELVKDLKAISYKWAAFKNLKPGLNSLAIEAGKQIEEFAKDSVQDESLRVIISALRTLSQSFSSLDLSDACDALLSQFAQLADQFFGMLSGLVADMFEQTVDFAQNLYAYIIEGQLFRTVKQSVGSVVQTVRKVLSAMDEHIQELAEWYYSYNGGEAGLLAPLKAAVYVRISEWEQYVEFTVRKYKVLLEELLFVPYGEHYANIVARYPETTRFLYRNVDVYVQRIRKNVMETDFHSTPLHKIKLVFEEPKMLSPAETRRAASEFVSKLHSLFGNLAVYDIKNGEIRHELPLNQLRYAGVLMSKAEEQGYSNLISSVFDSYLIAPLERFY